MGANDSTASKPRRYLALRPKEVSLVDEPANMREFLVTKRRDPTTPEDTMGDKTTTTTTTETESTPYKDVTAVKTFLDTLGKAEGAPKEALESVSKMLDAVAGAAESKPEGEPKAETTETPVAKTESKPEGEPKTETPVAKSEGEPKTETKPEGEPELANMVVVKGDGTVLINQDVVAQKGKTFSKGRTNELAGAFQGLATVMNEVDPEGTKAALSKLGFSASGATETPATTETPVAKSVEPALTSEFMDKLNAIVTSVENVTKRVGAIEDARTPSKSVEGEGGTDTAEVKKGFWNGVL